MTVRIRLATEADLPVLRAMMARAIAELQTDVLTPDQVAASATMMGLDTQLIADGTYFVAERDGAIAGCGGWSWRSTLYGGDHSPGRSAAPLDPAADAARVRAMYTHPDHVRQGVGKAVLAACEAAARAAGFRRTEMMATLAGERLYTACGYKPIEHITDTNGAVPVPMIRMGKDLVSDAC